ncbi:hypothetical protein GDO78_009940 [Eleutherodactylus coqui]|uniref:Uncharacterized protein n=1 Tax=Eleutherodactylus coqui TaxID=57060 RepID=A0A8J6FB55_ELECQ|nr:hypothetical protein GDO78_009940 [Eleutherodactylus coqui]
MVSINSPPLLLFLLPKKHKKTVKNQFTHLVFLRLSHPQPSVPGFLFYKQTCKTVTEEWRLVSLMQENESTCKTWLPYINRSKT